MAELETVETHAALGGVQGVYRHVSAATGTPMTFAVFVPPGLGPKPAVTFLSGLACTHANVMEKGEYRKVAAELDLVVICPDTSPRGPDVPDDGDYDLGQGAGFYLDATQAPWSKNFRMEAYVVDELAALVAAHFPIDVERQGVLGHSMGGHGALTLALRHDRWKSVSAFSPICAPSQVPWGRKAFTAYLGQDETSWREHDAVALIEAGRRLPPALVDIGDADPFLERELKPELLETACEQAGRSLELRQHRGYDHSYYFISTFMADHLRWHASHLRGPAIRSIWRATSP